MSGAQASTILAVEDDPDEAFLFQRAFRQAGVAAKLELVPDGEAALARLSSPDMTAPGLLLLDLRTPKLSGFEVLQRLRSGQGPWRFPIVMLTASAAPADVQRAYELGASAYLLKPLTVSAFAQLISVTCAFWLGANRVP